MKNFLLLIFSMLTLSAGILAQEPAIPVAWFPFDGDFLDYSGNNYHGTNMNTTWTTDRYGNPGNALSFNGSNSGVKLNNGCPPVFDWCLTFSCWVYFNDDSRGILFGSNDTPHNVNFEKHTGFRLRIYWNDGERDLFTASNVVSANAWYFLTFIRWADDMFEIYVNGQRKATFQDGGSNITPAGPFYIGRDSRTGTTVLNGKMDDVRIYELCMNETDVLALYNETPTLPELSTSPVTGITAISAISGGQIINAGGAPVTSRGIVWDTAENPTTESNLGMTSNGYGYGEFISNLTGLDPETNYYLRAYAANATGTGYGDQLIFTTPAVKIIFVNDDATGSNDGTSWNDAFTSFQAGLDVATFGNQIWVAAGTYKPDSAYDLTNSSRYYHFRMIEGVRIYGGFAGTETAVSQRTDFGIGGANETLLSGDLNGNDVVTGSGATLSITNNSENCYHVFYHPNGYVLTNTALLDGFTIKGGNANGSDPYDRGGGMSNYNATPVITHVTFLANSAKYGGGLYTEGNAATLAYVSFHSNFASIDGGGMNNNTISSQTITNALFQDNKANRFGGGMHNYNHSSPAITNVTFQSNNSSGSGTGRGGGLSNDQYSSPTLTNVTFRENSASIDGGGMYNEDHSSPIIINAEFLSNSTAHGGGLYNYNYSSPTVTNATFSGNNASVRGGGMYSRVSSSAVFKNCIVWGNTTTPGINGQQFCLDGGTTTMNYSCFANGAGDVYVMSGNFVTTNNNITKNPKFIDPAGDCRIHGNSPCVNTGNNDYNSETHDIRGEARIQDNTIDMGAYEWTSDIDPLTDTVYVSAGAAGSNSGTDWANALTSFQAALNLAANGDKIWVAAGTYKPSYAYDLTNSSRYYHFCMIEGVEIYGGFAGTENSISQRTDFGMDGAHETILSGDIGSAGVNTDNCYHVFFHPEGLNLTVAAILDGFTITGGYADGLNPEHHDRGGGMYNYQSSPTIINVAFLENFASYHGGGMINWENSPSIISVIFQSNSAQYGGGICNYANSFPAITNSVFSLNSADDGGGGMYNVHYSAPTVTNSVFSLNSSDYQGGGISNYNSSSPILNNCIVWGNTTTTGLNGQQFYLKNGGTTTLNYCCYANGTNDVTIVNDGTFTATNNNITTNPKFVDPAGDFRIYGDSPCVNAGNNDYNPETYDIRGEVRIQDDTIDMGAYEWTSGLDPATFTVYVRAGVTGNNNGTSWANAFTSLQSALEIVAPGEQIWVAAGTYEPGYDYGLGIGERGCHFRMTEGVRIFGGFAGTEDSISQRTDFGLGGANETILSGDIGIVGDHADNCYHVFYHPQGLNLTDAAILDGFTITGGNADGTNPHDGGGGMMNEGPCSPTITNVSFRSNAAVSGGGIFNSDSDPDLTNVIFLLNTAVQSGGGIYNDLSSHSITNATFSLNSAGNQGGGIYNLNSSPSLFNSIVWGNTATAGSQLFMDGGTTILNYCCYANSAGDITAVNAAVFTVTNNNITADPKFVNSAGDLRVLGLSPCLNAGNNDYNSASTDIRGEARIQDATIDMGAYEWKPGSDPYGIYYVKHDAAGSNNGSCWEDAFNSFQSALDVAVGGDTVWVVAGTYKPSYSYNLTNTSRFYHFRMIEGVAIYGGFAGTETSVNQRTDFGMGGANETILSGDIGTVGDNTDNCYHVFYHPNGLNLTGAAILDGFTITWGNANGSSPHDAGGGMHNYANFPTITKATFSSNTAVAGGGMYNAYSATSITNAIFSSNTADGGGGMYNILSSLSITNSTFTSNSAVSGGGMVNWASSPSIKNCIIWGNTASSGGKQLHILGGGTTTLNYTCYANGAGDVFGTPVTSNCITNNPILTEDLNLTWTNFPVTTDPAQMSPCIDSGDPLEWMNNPDDRDPDGSRMDMGAMYYHQIPIITVYNDGFFPGQYNYQYWEFSATYIPYTSNPKTFKIRNDANHFIDCPAFFMGTNPDQFKMKFPGDKYLSDTIFHLVPYEEKAVNVVFQPTSPLIQYADFTAGDITQYTDSIRVEGIGLSTGAVVGDVLTPTGDAVPEVTITVKALQNPWNSFTTTTNAIGHYNVVNIGAGSFRVIPFKMENDIIHDFTPDSVDFVVSAGATHTQNFQDISYFTVSGNISYLNTTCPSVGIPVLMDGAPAVPPVVTDPSGNYTVENVLIGSHTFMPDTTASGHQFDPAQISGIIMSPVAGFNFSDTFTYNLSGYVTGNCGIPLDDSIALIVECQNDCGITDTIYTDAEGFYSINLAPFQYNITPVPFDYFGTWIEFDTEQVDVSEQDATLDFIYHSDPVIEIKGFDTLTNPYGWIVLEQFEIYAIEIDVIELYGENNEIRGRVDSGNIIITDDLSDFDQDSTMAISDSATLYYFRAGYPNIIGGGAHPYQKKIKVEYFSEEGKSASAEAWVYITGILPRGTAFATTTPEIPLLILRDPPGDQSYSELTNTTEISQAISFSAKYEAGASTFRKLSLGLKYEVNTWLFGKLDIETTLDFTQTLGLTMSQNSLTENQLKFVTTESFKTSQGENVVGGKADLYMGGAMNLLYGITDVLTISHDTVNIGQDIIIAPEGFATRYIYTENHIETVVIPSLYLIQDTVSAERWESFIALNNSLKEAAIFKENIDFNAGASTSHSLETTRSHTNTQEFELTLNADIAMEAGLKINGIGLTGGVTVSSAMTHGSSETNSIVNSTKIDYTLDDNDEGEEGEPSDDFSVDIKTDPVYGTPVFKTVAGNSMCPWEGPPTNSRKGCAFSEHGYYEDDIPVGVAAEFAIWLNNTSQTEETMTYILKVLNETNPYSATFIPASLTEPDGIEYTLEYGTSQLATVYIIRPPGEVYDLTGLTLELSGDCEGSPNVSDQATIEVHWIHPCSRISIQTPGNNWVINQASSNQLQLTVSDYDLANPNLLSLSLEYSGDNGNNWIEFYSIPRSSIQTPTLQVSWDVENLTDGQYQLRAIADCAEGVVNYSENIIGIIDRTSPLVFGNPQPADGVLNIGDEISFAFNESLKPSTVTINTCRLFETETGLQVGASVVYQPATRKVVFTINPGNAYFIENRYLTSQIVGVQDKYGNPLADTASWTFLVDQGPLHWNPDDFMFTISDGESINFSSMLTNVSADEVYYSLTLPEWLSATPFSGYVSGNGASVEVDFMSAPLPGGIYYDTIFATTVGYPAEKIHIMIQTAGGPELSVNPSNREVLAPAGTTTFDITSNVNWTVSEDVDWLSVDPPGGSNNGVLTVNFGENNSGSFRIGEITVTGGGGLLPLVVTVVQQSWLIHSVNLPAGWSGLSSYVTPFDPDIEHIFGSVLDNLIIAMTQQNMYYPANEINTIGNWASQSAYKVKTNAGITLNITGS
ncbi:MAG: hypothetical protein IH598_09785, partial [Bacteroidales bacterium]|nr:hypothetical protein [Bacteroidales bacterium]